MKAVIYFTEVPQQYEHKNMEHMIGEKLLAQANASVWTVSLSVAISLASLAMN